MSVYFITAREIGMVKIGCANDPWDRLEKLRTASPVELTLEAVFNGSYEGEREHHKRFAEHRIRGEWFKLIPEIETIIAESSAPAREYEGKTRAQRRKLQSGIDAVGSRLIQRARADEQLADEQIRIEREMLAESERIFAAMDAERALDLETPQRREKVA